MIVCPICKKENHHLAITCLSCGSFLQNKIDNLDLFSTAWNLLEKPQSTFHKIALAHHKNYTLFLSSIAGIGMVFFMFWIMKIGDQTDSLIRFIITGFVVGIPFGIVSILIYSFLVVLVGILKRRKVAIKNAFAVASYSLIPVVISVILVLPLEIMTLGVFFFTSNPSPYQLKPTSYVLLLILDSIFILWSLGLLLSGLKKLFDSGWLTALIIQIVTLTIYAGLVYGFTRLITFNIF